MSPAFEIAITIITSVLTSSGLWACIMKRSDANNAEKAMLRGLGHDRIVFLGMRYIERGWITKDEYENLNDYLYEPYKALGGNGTAKKVMDDVARLPIREEGGKKL